MTSDYIEYMKETNDWEQHLMEIIPGFKPLSYESADRILRNVLLACGYKEAHLIKLNNGIYE